MHFQTSDSRLRTAKLPASYEESPTVLAVKTDQEGFKVSGFSQSCKSVTICDGASDFFDLVHPCVKKSFKSTAALRTALGWDREAATKLYAVILEDYASKGTAAHEVLVQGRIRTGYGKANVTEIVRCSGTRLEKQSFFASASASAKSTELNQNNKVNGDEGEGVVEEHDEQRDEEPIPPPVPPTEQVAELPTPPAGTPEQHTPKESLQDSPTGEPSEPPQVDGINAIEPGGPAAAATVTVPLIML